MRSLGRRLAFLLGSAAALTTAFACSGGSGSDSPTPGGDGGSLSPEGGVGPDGSLTSDGAVSATTLGCFHALAGGESDAGGCTADDWCSKNTAPPTDPDLPSILSVRGLGPTDVWAVSLGGGVLHFDGTSWSLTATLPVPSGGTLTSIWPISATDVWTVGTSGFISHYD